MSGAIEPAEITGLLLAGGMGTRMGGIDKGLINLNDAPLALYAMEALAVQTGKLIINANRNHDAYSQIGAKFAAIVIADTQSADWPSQAGPLAGFYTGLTHCTTPYLLTCPCDTPHIPPNLAHKLSLGLVEANADVAMACQKDEEGSLQRESVFCLMKSNLANSLYNYLHSGGRKVAQWIESQNHVLVSFDTTAQNNAFANVNTPEELRRLQLSKSATR